MPDGVNIPGGPSFIGNPQPPDVPCDPTGDGWRGPPGPVGPIGPIGPQGLPGALTGGVMTGPLYWTATGSTASRSAQDRSADGVNALDYGVLLDGATNNTAFLNAARVAAKHNGSVFLPSGLIHGPLATSSGPTTAVLWKLDGTTFPDGATPITQIGAPGDTVESYYNGYKYFAKQQNPVGAFAPVVRIDLTQNLTGAGGGGIAYGLNVNATQNAGDTALVYALAVNCTNNADVTSGGMAGIQSTVSKSGGGQAWALQTVTRDTTGLASSANGHGMVGIEAAIRAVALDDASNALTWGGLGNRVALHLSLTLPVGTASGTEAQFSQGIRVSGDAVGTKCYVNSVYGVDLNVDTYQVFDARGAGAPWNYGSNPVAALRMAAGQVVDFNGGPALNSAPGAYLQYTTSGTSRLRYMAGANEVWSVSDAGAWSGTGLGVAPGLLPVWGNFQGTGNPSLTAPAATRMIFTAAAPATGDYGTVEVRRVTTYTGGAGGSVGALRVNSTIGAGDNNGEWNLIAQCSTSSTGANATAVGAFLQGTRTAGTSAIWGGIADARDTTGLSSASGKAVLGMEIDVEANKLDDGGNANSVASVGIRKGIQVVAFRYNTSDNTPAEVTNGLWFTCGDPTYPFYDSLIGVGAGTQARQALDTRGMVPVTGSAHPVYSVVMPHDHAIEFNAANTWDVTPASTLQYRAATSRWYYSVGGVDQFSIDASGNVRARGTFTGSTTP